MARPRVHDLDQVLDGVEELLSAGEREVTIRAVAELTGASSGSLYHAFSSRNELVARAWLRAAQRFLDLQAAAVDDVLLGDGPDRAREAVVAAASTLVDLQDVAPSSSRLLVEHRRNVLLAGELPDALRADLTSLDTALRGLLRRLADASLGRHDRQAVDVIAICVVDLPAALLRPRPGRVVSGRVALRSAVLGVLDDADLLATWTARRG